MARKPGIPRTERLLILYSEEEYRQLKKVFARSVSRTISSYVRKVSLEEPVEMINRNASFDDFIGEIVQLRIEMTAIRKMGLLSGESQARLIDLHEEIQKTITKIAELCMPQ